MSAKIKSNVSQKRQGDSESTEGHQLLTNNKNLEIEVKLCNSARDINSVKKHEIPDGGYGWVVVFSSLLTFLIIDGVAFSFGLIYTKLQSHFEESRTGIAWVGSLLLSVPLIVGPPMSYLVDKYGCRTMTIVGGILSGLGFVLASISQSVEALFVTFGVISGFGLGVGYVSAIVSITFWFDKYRALATGIGSCGTGIGTFVFAPFINFLLEKYDWRGATLVVGGVLLNKCVCGCLFRDPDWLIKEKLRNSKPVQETPMQRHFASIETLNNQDVDLNNNNSFMKYNHVFGRRLSITASTESLSNVRTSNVKNSKHGNVEVIPEGTNKKLYNDYINIMKSMFDFSLFLNLKFTLFSLSTFLLYSCYIIPYFYLPEEMLPYNYTESDSAILISILGIFNTIGMITLGYMGDKPWVNIPKTYGFCLLLCGISLGLMPSFVTYYPALTALCIIHGLTFASTLTYTSSIVVSIVGLENFTCAFGVVLLVQGLGSLVGPPLATFICDFTLRLDNSFYIGGILIGCAGIFAFFIGFLQDKEKIQVEK